MKPQNKKRQANQYDKIFKENIESDCRSSSNFKHHAKCVGISATSMEELPDDIQHTKERKPDTLKKITDDKGNTFILQILPLLVFHLSKRLGVPLLRVFHQQHLLQLLGKKY